MKRPGRPRANRLPLLLPVLLLLFTGSGHGQIVWPDTDEEKWLLCFVDVETTGLEPGYHEMIDVGMIYTDLEGEELGRLFRRIQVDHPARASEGAVAVNAFDPARWDSLRAVTKEEAVADIRELHHRVANDERVLLVAFNSHFDTAFLRHLFLDAGASWRDHYFYYVLDIPSMAWSLGYRQLRGQGLADALGVPDEPHVARDHTGITGAELNLRLYRALLAASPVGSRP